MGKLEDLTGILEAIREIDLSGFAANYQRVREIRIPEVIEKTKVGGGDPMIFSALFETILHEVMSSLKGIGAKENSFDLHVHAKITRDMQLRNHDIDDVINTAHRKGLSGVAITEHLDRAMDFIKMMDDSHYSQYFSESHPGLLLVPGCEVRIAQGKCDMIVLASSMEAIKELDALAGKSGGSYHITQGYVPSFSELVEVVNAVKARYGPVALIGAHIFRKEQMLCIPETLECRDGVDLSLVDALETTAKDHEFAEQALRKRDSSGKPLVYSSDAHNPLQIGAGYITFNENMKSAGDAVRAVAEGRFCAANSASDITPKDTSILKFCSLYKEAHRIAHKSIE